MTSSPARTRSSISRRSPRPSCGRRATRSGSTPSRRTTSSRPPSPAGRAGGVGVERDGPRAAVRSAAGLRPDRRVDHAAPRVVVRALEARRRDDGRPVRPADTASRSSGCGSRTSWNRPTTPEFPGFQADARLRKWNLWGYVDARDVAAAVRGALEADTTGAEVCIVAAADTVMTRDSADLMAEVFPDVPLRRESRAARRCSRSTARGTCSAIGPPTRGRTNSPRPGRQRRGDRDRRTRGRPAVARPGADGAPPPPDAQRSARRSASSSTGRGGSSCSDAGRRSRRTMERGRRSPAAGRCRASTTCPQYTNVQMPFPGQPPDDPGAQPDRASTSASSSCRPTGRAGASCSTSALPRAC